MGESEPKMVLMPAMMLQPRGVTEEENSPPWDARSMAPRPPPLAMHQPKMAKAAMGIVIPLIVKT